MQNKRLENSVRSLTNLYTVVIGAALSLAVASAINVNTGLQSLTASSMFLFVAFIATLFPFFHGALRHLDDAYIENNNQNIKAGALIVDFLLLFLHALTFLVLSQLLKKPTHFAWFLIGVLAIDVVWGVFSYFGSSSNTQALSAESKWTVINIVFIAVVASYLVSQDAYLNSSFDPFKLSVLLAIACVFRSVVDYIWCWRLYFPEN